jgi:hypothetical protein
MDKRFNQQLNILTATGALPVLLCFLISQYPSIPLQKIIFVYITIVLSFVAGVDWLLGIKLKSFQTVCWAIFCSLLPFLILSILLIFPGSISSLRVLLLLLLQLILMLWADTKIYKWAAMQQALSFRYIGTFCLCTAIVVNCVITF